MAGRGRWLKTAGMLGLVAGLIAGCGGDKPRPSGSNIAYWEPQIQKASKRFNVPPEWIREVMRIESGGRSTWKGGQPITSSAGAQGLMQVMPATYEELRQKHSLGRDPYDPENNIMAGTAYIRELYEMYGSPGFLGAYNAGPGRYRQYVEAGRSLPPETRRYMDIVGPQIAGIEPGSSRPDRMTQYAEQQIQNRVDDAVAARTGQPGSRSPVVMAMAPIPDRLSPEEQGTMSRVDAAIADRTGQPIPAQPIPVQAAPIRQAPLPAPASRPVVVAMQPIPDRVAPMPAPVAAVRQAAVRPAPVRMAPIPDRPQVAPVDDVLLAMAASQPERPSPAPVATRAVAQPQARQARPVPMPSPVPAPTPVTVAPTRVAATAPAAPVRRQASGLPSGWYVPSAPAK
ncbi:transglycosylase SLT domain-containing protein [Inquilinus sp. CA228]|uniref:lytic transglycosylase domain-containing protein n=1 Tax=Inquilinus sp. CA228 TaxID=3455609 RepID=UPI003F8D4B61